MNKFIKEERLCSKKFISELFSNGSSFLFYPFRVTWLVSSNQQQSNPIQIVIAVPKKRFKKSVDRNLIKRKIKESYRLNKQKHIYDLIEGKKIWVACSYIGSQIHDYQFINQKMLVMLKTLSKKLEVLNEPN